MICARIYASLSLSLQRKAAINPNDALEVVVKYFVTLTSNLIKKIEEQSGTIANLQTRLDKLEGEGVEILTISPNMNGDLDTINTKQKFMNEVVKKQSERKKRENNVAIVEAKESTKSNTQEKLKTLQGYY
jgi:hypothetical protein